MSSTKYSSVLSYTICQNFADQDTYTHIFKNNFPLEKRACLYVNAFLTLFSDCIITAYSIKNASALLQSTVLLLCRGVIHLE